MIRIGNSSFSPEPAAPAKGSAASSNADKAGVQVPDQVQLSQLTATVLQGRSDRIAALKAIVASPDYTPQMLPVSRKLVAGALTPAE